ncbi:hypothetical protein HispidOSU_029939 [Sigmodon hispidus]
MDALVWKSQKPPAEDRYHPTGWSSKVFALCPGKSFRPPPPRLPTHPSVLSWLIGSESPTLLVLKQKLPPGGPQADRGAGTWRKGEDRTELERVGGKFHRGKQGRAEGTLGNLHSGEEMLLKGGQGTREESRRDWEE